MSRAGMSTYGIVWDQSWLLGFVCLTFCQGTVCRLANVAVLVCRAGREGCREGVNAGDLSSDRRMSRRAVSNESNRFVLYVTRRGRMFCSDNGVPQDHDGSLRCAKCRARSRECWGSATPYNGSRARDFPGDYGGTSLLRRMGQDGRNWQRYANCRRQGDGRGHRQEDCGRGPRGGTRRCDGTCARRCRGRRPSCVLRRGEFRINGHRASRPFFTLVVGLRRSMGGEDRRCEACRVTRGRRSMVCPRLRSSNHWEVNPNLFNDYGSRYSSRGSVRTSNLGRAWQRGRVNARLRRQFPILFCGIRNHVRFVAGEALRVWDGFEFL